MDSGGSTNGHTVKMSVCPLASLFDQRTRSPGPLVAGRLLTLSFAGTAPVSGTSSIVYSWYFPSPGLITASSWRALGLLGVPAWADPLFEDSPIGGILTERSELDTTFEFARRIASAHGLFHPS